MELRKRTVEVFTKSNLSINVASMMRGAINLKQIQAFVDVFLTNPKLIFKHQSLFQLWQAVLNSMHVSPKLYWDELLASEKVMQLNANSEESQSLLRELTNLTIHPIAGSKAYFPVDAILKLAIFVYSLCNLELHWEDELQFKQAIISSLISQPQV